MEEQQQQASKAGEEKWKLNLPAYSVPRIIISFSAKFRDTEVDEVIPVVYLLAGKAPAL